MKEGKWDGREVGKGGRGCKEGKRTQIEDTWQGHRPSQREDSVLRTQMKRGQKEGKHCI